MQDAFYAVANIDRWSGWPEGTFERSATHDCIIVSGDFDECVTCVKCNTFQVNFVVSLDPLGLVWINIHTLIIISNGQYVELFQWAFGIVMWELLTLGQQPYAEIDPFEMTDYLMEGFRIAQPINCPDELWALYYNSSFDSTVKGRGFSTSFRSSFLHPPPSLQPLPCRLSPHPLTSF